MLFCKSHLMSKYSYGAFSLVLSLPRKKNRKSQFATIKKTERDNKVWIQFHFGLRTLLPHPSMLAVLKDVLSVASSFKFKLCKWRAAIMLTAFELYFTLPLGEEKIGFPKTGHRGVESQLPHQSIWISFEVN